MISMAWLRRLDVGRKLRRSLAHRVSKWRVTQILRYLAEDAAGIVADIGYGIRDRARAVRHWSSRHGPTKA
jgi:hypothetical protein